MKILLLILLFSVVSFAQQVIRPPKTGVKKDMIRGDYTILSWKVKGDYSAHDLAFIVKATTALASPRLIWRGNYVTGSDTLIGVSAAYTRYSTIACTLYSTDTQGFTSAAYYYDITSATDSTTLIAGLLTMFTDVSTPVDGAVPGAERITTIALDNATADEDFIWWQYEGTDSAKWKVTDFDSIKVALQDTVNFFRVVIIDDAITTTSTSGFTTAPTFVLSSDTLIATSSGAELDAEGIVQSNDWDFTIPSASASQIKVLFDDLTTDTTVVFWQNDIFDSRFITQLGDTYNFDTTSIDGRIDLKLDIVDTTAFRTFSDLKYSAGASADTSAVRTFSDLKYLKNADSTAIRTWSDTKYLADADSTAIRTFSDLKYLKNADSTAVRAFSDLKYGLITDTTDVRTFSDAKYVAKTEQKSYPYEINSPTVYDTNLVFHTRTAIIIDSVWTKIAAGDDSVTFQIRFGADGTGTNVFSSAQLITTEGYLSTFNDNTIPAENEVYIYYTALGDTTNKLLLDFRFRENQ